MSREVVGDAIGRLIFLKLSQEQRKELFQKVPASGPNWGVISRFTQQALRSPAAARTLSTHFVEHMGFKATKSFERGELIEYLATLGMQYGADLNAASGTTSHPTGGVSKYPCVSRRCWTRARLSRRKTPAQTRNCLGASTPPAAR